MSGRKIVIDTNSEQSTAGGGASRSDSKRHKKSPRSIPRAFPIHESERFRPGAKHGREFTVPFREANNLGISIARRPSGVSAAGPFRPDESSHAGPPPDGRKKDRGKNPRSSITAKSPPPLRRFRTERGGYSACCCSVCPAEGISACGIVAAASDSMTRS